MAVADKWIFIDRDGVINKDLNDYVKRWPDFEFIPGVLDAFRLLKQAGFDVIIISNQAGIGDRQFPLEDLQEITKQMLVAITEAGGAVRDVFYCLHGKAEGCACRKPEPGLFELAHQKYPFSPEKTYFIGDKDSDILAGKRFGLKTILVKTGYGEEHQHRMKTEDMPDFIADDLYAAVKQILGGQM